MFFGLFAGAKARSFPTKISAAKVIPTIIKSVNLSATTSARMKAPQFKHGLLLLVTQTSAAIVRSPLVSFAVGDYSHDDVIVRDVAIVGGGASGTFAAVRLQQDLNQSVAVVEQNQALGGHTETYHDLESSSTIEVGVLAFHDLPLVYDFFARFDIPLTNLPFNLSNFTNVDFRTGQPVSKSVDPNETMNALRRWTTQLARHSTLSEGFVFPYPVPDDLLIPFGQFVERHNLGAMVSVLWEVCQGYGDILSLPTLYLMKAFNSAVVRGLSTGFLVTLRQNNHEIYEKALDLLGNGDNVFLGSHVVAMQRDLPDPFAQAVVATPSGYKLLRAKQFLFAIPPNLDSLTGFDLDERELAIFSHFTNTEYCTGLLEDALLAPGAVYANMEMNPSTFCLPRLPASYTLGPTAGSSNLTHITFGSNATMTFEKIRDQVVAETMRVIPGSAPQFAKFLSHGPFALHVSADLIRTGFYQAMNQLQGRRRSYWTGAAWHVHDSSLLWNFTNNILALMQQSGI